MFKLVLFFLRNSPSSSLLLVMQVFYCGWITAVSTGLGVLPFLVFNEPNKFYMGVSNAIAGGMMLAASVSLLREGLTPQEEHSPFQLPPWQYAWLGSALGKLHAPPNP